MLIGHIMTAQKQKIKRVRKCQEGTEMNKNKLDNRAFSLKSVPLCKNIFFCKTDATVCMDDYTNDLLELKL